ncbi:MAG: LysR family transcriptional regulator, partial [Pseudomonadales bacterium]|nr:LysR family transcriptional regulator [Pseudomonadales bacterium]
MDKLHLLRLFIKVVDTGSFSKAAAELGFSPSTLSKAIGRLENDLGCHLFHRTTRQLILTKAGEAYLHTVRRLVDDLEQCETNLNQRNEDASGLLKINLPVSYGRRYVVPLLSAFNAQYPNITLDIRFDDAYVDMIATGTDICIRSGTLAPSSLIARQLSPIAFLICASPRLLKSSRIVNPEEFNHFPWIRFRFAQTGRLMPIMVANHSEPDGQENLDPGQQFIVDDGETLAELCSQGLGLTQLPHFIARDWLDAGKIVPVGPAFRAKGFGVWAIYVKRTFLPLRIRLFVEFLENTI